MPLDITTILIAAAVLGVAALLALGLAGFARGADPKASNRRMWWRVAAQAVVLALIVLAFWERSQR